MKVHQVMAVLLVAASTSYARADVPPPRGYVESCTVQAHAQDGRECRECSTYHGNPPTHCASEVGDGYERACRTRGASTWSEVWCRGSATTPQAGPAAVEEAQDCSVASASLLTPTLAGLLAAMTARRWRRRARTASSEDSPRRRTHSDGATGSNARTHR